VRWRWRNIPGAAKQQELWVHSALLSAAKERVFMSRDQNVRQNSQ
jgi:hypothetical protein